MCMPVRVLLQAICIFPEPPFSCPIWRLCIRVRAIRVRRAWSIGSQQVLIAIQSTQRMYNSSELQTAACDLEWRVAWGALELCGNLAGQPKQVKVALSCSLNV